jgi:hypothetical protein
MGELPRRQGFETVTINGFFANPRHATTEALKENAAFAPKLRDLKAARPASVAARPWGEPTLGERPGCRQHRRCPFRGRARHYVKYRAAKARREPVRLPGGRQKRWLPPRR